MRKITPQVELVPDTEARKEFGNPCKMTWGRWEEQQPTFHPPSALTAANSALVKRWKLTSSRSSNKRCRLPEKDDRAGLVLTGAIKWEA